jgi:hypothetical protein
MRGDFSEGVKRTVAMRVANRCSKPDCHATTSGPQLDPAKALNLGVGAHITAASPGGPRYDSSLTPKERSSTENAIWLCQNCAKLVDNDANRFTADLLRASKRNAEDEAIACIGKPSGTTPDADAISKLALMDARFKMVIDDYKVRGTPRFMIDTFADMSQEEKVALCHRAVMWKKNRRSKRNPYLPTL